MKQKNNLVMPRNKRGVALIMAVAIVGILAGIAVTFAYNMKIDQKAAGNYLALVKARYLAEAGIARAIAELKNDKASSYWFISAIDRLYNSSSGAVWNEVWADGGTFSGPTNGTLGEGYFDLRYARTIAGTGDTLYTELRQDRYLNETSSDDVNGHVINGIIDEERKININYVFDILGGPDNHILLEGLPGIGDALAKAIIDNRPADGYKTITEILKAPGIGLNKLYGDDDGTISPTITWTKANNHRLDSPTYENDGGTVNVIDGGIEDLITVSTDSVLDAGVNPSPINVNTAPKTVLKAVIGGISGISAAERNIVVQAILDYRSGAVGGYINPNPFDGIDQNRGDGLDPNAINPPANSFTADGLDNDGDGTAIDADEAYMFAGGPRGEFNSLIYLLRPAGGGYNGGGTISDADVLAIMDNADPASNVDYNGDGNADNQVWTTSFIFKSKYFQIISTGVVLKNGIPIAEQKIMQIVGPIEK